MDRGFQDALKVLVTYNFSMIWVYGAWIFLLAYRRLLMFVIRIIYNQNTWQVEQQKLVNFGAWEEYNHVTWSIILGHRPNIQYYRIRDCWPSLLTILRRVHDQTVIYIMLSIIIWISHVMQQILCVRQHFPYQSQYEPAHHLVVWLRQYNRV